MIISNRKKFIFIHIYKVAGSSITKVLKKFDDCPLIYKTMNNKILSRIQFISRNNPYRFHVSAKELQDTVDGYDDFFKFAIVRNPFDWQVSLYSYIKRRKTHFEYNHVKDKSFGEYLRWRVKKENIRTLSDFVTDDHNNLIIDSYGKLENIDEYFDSIKNRLGVSDSLPHVNKTKHKPYQDYYNEELKKLIEIHFAEDLERFDYKFES